MSYPAVTIYLVRKGNQMNVTVMLNNFSKIYPSYDPQHLSEVVGFYQKQYWTGQIQGYKVELNDGTIFAVGGSF
jgi:hypothetical protein